MWKGQPPARLEVPRRYVGESVRMVWLLLIGLALATSVVFVWRSDTLTGVIGVVLGVFCAVWLLGVIQASNSRHTWSASPIPRAYYYALVAACGVAAVTSAYYAVRGLIRFADARRRARMFVPDVQQRPTVTATRACPHCGRMIPAQAIACK